MSKNKRAHKDTRSIKVEAQKMVRSLNITGENKEQTQQIVQGVTRAMEAFLRQQSEKTRELDKKVKKVNKLQENLAEEQAAENNSTPEVVYKTAKLPWVLFAGACVVIAGLLLFPIR